MMLKKLNFSNLFLIDFQTEFDLPSTFLYRTYIKSICKMCTNATKGKIRVIRTEYNNEACSTEVMFLKIIRLNTVLPIIWFEFEITAFAVHI